MKKNEIIDTINSLINDIKNTKQYDFSLENYSIQELRELAVYLYSNNDEYPPSKFNILIKNILQARCRLMNQNFIWSEENKARFLEVNEKLIQAVDEAYVEASKILADINKRMKNNDPFLVDFEIEINMSPYIKYYEEDNDMDFFGEVLANPTGICSPISYSFGNFERSPDKSDNWNWEYFNGEFDNDYIGHAIHALLDTLIWSFQDIMDIERISTDIEVSYQNFKGY